MYDILLIGNRGQLGWELERCLGPLGRIAAMDYPAIDLADEGITRRVARGIWGTIAAGGKSDAGRTRVIINAAAYTAVDRAESESELAMAVNAAAPGILAEEARSAGAAFVHYSTDYVFDGIAGRPYNETDPPNPLGVYGASKLAGEQAVAVIGGPHLILRTAWVYSLRGDSFVTKVLHWAYEQETLHVVTDQVSNPTWARSLALATAHLLTIAAGGSEEVNTGADQSARFSLDNKPSRPRGPKDNRSCIMSWIERRAGLYHLAGDGYTSRFEWAEEILALRPQKGEKRVKKIEAALTSDFPAAAKRPTNSALDCARFERTFGFHLPPWRTALREAFQTSAHEAI